MQPFIISLLYTKNKCSHRVYLVNASGVNQEISALVEHKVCSFKMEHSKVAYGPEIFNVINQCLKHILVEKKTTLSQFFIYPCQLLIQFESWKLFQSLGF